MVCAALIAERKVNTLIILEKRSLIPQWKQALGTFLQIREELPAYQTRTGQTRVRKELIGTLCGSKDSLTGIVDIAMARSLFSQEEGVDPRLEQYGLILVDECHHAAADTHLNVLRAAKAKYQYGVTATLERSDGLEKLTQFLLGPVRFRFTAKERANEQGIAHLVYPRRSPAGSCPQGAGRQ